MTRKLPSEEKLSSFVKKDVEQSLLVADTLNGKRPYGGKFGSKQKNKAIDTTQEFDQFLKDVNFMLQSYTSTTNKVDFSVERLKTSIASLRDKTPKGKK
jgi:hypothetical protein